MAMNLALCGDAASCSHPQVYLNDADKPAVGEGLNCAARVRLFACKVCASCRPHTAGCAS